MTADENTYSKKSPFSFWSGSLKQYWTCDGGHPWTSGNYKGHEACWNGSTGWVSQHEGTLTQRLHLHFRKPWHFLQDKVTPLCTFMQKTHKELYQDFSKKNHLGDSWQNFLLVWVTFERQWNSLISRVQQNTFWIPVCFPNPSRLFEEKRGSSKGNFCHSSLQLPCRGHSTRSVSVLSTSRCSGDWRLQEPTMSVPVRVLKDLKNHRPE